jgi:hypothetical protein
MNHLKYGLVMGSITFWLSCGSRIQDDQAGRLDNVCYYKNNHFHISLAFILVHQLIICK